MPVPTWVVGQVLTASDVNSWFVPLSAIKTADQSVTSSTAFVNDTELFVPIVASGSYQFECFLYFEGGTAGSSDIKWKWIIPTGTAMRYTWTGWSGNTTVARSGDGQVAGDTPASGTAGAGNTHGVIMIGTIVAGVNAGNLQLQWAQNTSSGTSTIVHAQSCLVLRRIA